MAKNFEQMPGELAMRTVLLVQEYARRNPNFLMGDIVQNLMRDYGVCRATGFRYVRRAVDVLCLPYDANDARKSRAADRISDGLATAKLCEFPNGVPGARRSRA